MLYYFLDVIRILFIFDNTIFLNLEERDMNKKTIGLVLTMVMLCTTGVTCLAAEDSDNKQKEAQHKVLVIREDVSKEEAMSDATYDSVQAQMLETEVGADVSISRSGEPHWDVWGSREDKIENGVSGAVPIGYSRLVDSMGVEYKTYHYTRTYLGSLKRGDSGRCWGNDYIVKAIGKFCDDDVWCNNIHIVKYGTEG